ncbi:hypothetical protein OCV51_01755 [Faecalicatena acetigenes]|uniref:Pesticidal crystal protein Cry22Aa Ig-like domain-containing protein n=1 Tax=Faecalicatena acetigenes TaxID=2981790 RepID=A0ABT2T836_9FIRM|nr:MULTISPECIES: hypothetical protein [Lachnospiraceae]MCU6746392.1 hypothetical protein [Faecalicatena acetigenes]
MKEKFKNLLKQHKKEFVIGTCVLVLAIAGISISFLSGNDTADIKQEETVKKQNLFSSVKGIKDLYVVQNLKNVDWLKDVTYDKNKLKEIKVNDKNVDVTKIGEYKLTYTAISKDKKETEDKIVKVTVVNTQEAEKLAKAGKAVWTSDTAVAKSDDKEKKDSKKEAGKSDEKASEDVVNNSASVSNDTGTNSVAQTQGENVNSDKGSSSGSNSSTDTSNNNSGGETGAGGHYEPVWIVTKEAWTEVVEEPIYEKQLMWYCNTCGENITKDPEGHIDATMHAGYRNTWEDVVIGTNRYEIYHDAEGYWDNQWVEN